MNTSKYNLSIINNEKCDCINDTTKSCDIFSNRNQLINDCIPLINLKDGKINIIDWQYGYIYYNSTNTEIYSLNKDFSLNKYDGKNPEYINTSPNLLKDLLDKNIIISETEQINKTTSAISSKIQSGINLIEIPVYYLYTNNNNEIFNIFITQYFLMKKSLKGDINNLFRIDDKNIFITLSYKFNIFNISLLCEKFFDIIPLFLNDYEKDELTRILTDKIFVGFNFVNLYTTINGYKHMLKTISTDSIHNDFNSSKPKIDNIKFTGKDSNPKFRDYKKIYNIEINNESNPNTQISIIDELVNSIILIRTVLNQLNRLIPDFDKLFLMSMLNYRLKEGLINNTWPFNKNNILEYIVKNNKINSSLDISKLKPLYKIEKPIIYEYTTVNYKGEEYGNCMENTILQFLKILFYNPNKLNYDNDIIKQIIKPEYENLVIDLFKKIDFEEKTKKFDEEWVKFITELPEKNNYILGNYNFLKDNKELNPILGNLILSLRYLTKIEYSTDDTFNDKTFLNLIINLINTVEDYSIIIKNDITTDTVTINCYNKYTMILEHKKHARFESAKIDDDNLSNILENITINYKSLIEYLNTNSYLTYSDLSNYVFLSNLIIKNELFDSYLALLADGKKQKYLNLIFSDSVIQKISPDIFDLILNIIDVKYFEDFKNWENILRYVKSDIFWKNLMEKNLYKNWELELWRHSRNIESYIFWQYVFNKNLCNNWSNSIWSIIFYFGNKYNFNILQAIIDTKYYTKWGTGIWELAKEKVLSKEFWSNVNSSLIIPENYDVEMIIKQIINDNVYKIKNLISENKSKYKNKYLNPSSDIYSSKYLKYDLNKNSNPSSDIYFSKYQKYKMKYLDLKKSLNLK